MPATITQERLKFLEFLEVVSTLPEDHYFSCARGFLSALAVESPALALSVEAQIEAHFSKVQLKNKRNKVIVVVHGIRTQAAWFSLVRSELENYPQMNIEECKYSWKNGISFAFPSIFKYKAISRTLDNLHTIFAGSKDSDVYLIAHSNGTFVMKEIMENHPYFDFKGIIYCGSVVDEFYKWEKIKNFPEKMFVNDMGTTDNYPVYARALSSAYGASGRFGFNYTAIRNRRHNFGHSGFFTKSHFEKFWLPFLAEGEIAASTWDLERPEEKWLAQNFPKSRSVKIFLLLIFVFVMWCRFR